MRPAGTDIISWTEVNTGVGGRRYSPGQRQAGLDVFVPANAPADPARRDISLLRLVFAGIGLIILVTHALSPPSTRSPQSSKDCHTGQYADRTIVRLDRLSSDHVAKTRTYRTAGKPLGLRPWRIAYRICRTRSAQPYVVRTAGRSRSACHSSLKVKPLYPSESRGSRHQERASGSWTPAQPRAPATPAHPAASCCRALSRSDPASTASRRPGCARPARPWTERDRSASSCTRAPTAR